jgi:hypothetical protein
MLVDLGCWFTLVDFGLWFALLKFFYHYLPLLTFVHFDLWKRLSCCQKRGREAIQCGISSSDYKLSNRTEKQEDTDIIIYLYYWETMGMPTQR